MDHFSPLYPILDSSLLPERDRSAYLRKLALELLEAGVSLLQYRNKSGTDREILDDAKILRAAMPQGQCTLILNDRADLAVLAGFDGVHVGQNDISAASARLIVGIEKIVGISTHNEEQLQAATLMPVDYIAIGPVLPTSSKLDPEPVVGLEGVRAARALTSRPLVAIGGITLENCEHVRDAGADSVAVISSLFGNPSAASPANMAAEFLKRLR
jgi:thiamine-phosphate pyrophosphorylase